MGDAKLAHHLLSFTDIELEEAGFELVDTEANADAEIDAEVNLKSETRDIGLGVMKLVIKANGKTDTEESCEGLSTDTKGDFFGSSAEGAITGLRQKYPNAKTIKLDTASDMAASKTFGYPLSGALKSSGFSTSDSEEADVVLTIILLRKRIPIEENGLTFKTRITLRDGSNLVRSEGPGLLSARAMSPPELCPDRVADLDWMLGQDVLFQLAKGFTKSLKQHNRRIEAVKK